MDRFNNSTLSLISEPISDITVGVNSGNTTINLFNHFDDPFSTGLVAIFQLHDTFIGDGIIGVLLFDQSGKGAPLTVENFLNYVNDGRYTNTFIHRSVPDFIIQGGGFTVDESGIDQVPANPPVQNEFSPNRSNLQGTIAMAKLGNDPNSATNQWFFNLNDNSSNLDSQNGGFTVFGQVLGNDDLATIEAIANIPTFDVTNFNSAFGNLPLKTDPSNATVEDFIRFQSITVSENQELNFSVNNSRPDLVNVTINNGQLELDYLPNASGTAEIAISATTLLGETEVDSFNVSVTGNGGVNLNSPIYRFQNSNVPGTYLFAGEGESQSIRLNNPNFIEEGIAFKVGIEPGDGLIAMNRFQNSNVPGTYLYAGEEESQSIRLNNPNFIEEGVAFYVYAAGSAQAQPFYRFQNLSLPGTYLFVGDQERQNILANFPNFQEEGIAFEVGV